VQKLRLVSDVPGAPRSPWNEWGRLTRFLESTRLAFARERSVWAPLGPKSTDQVEIVAPKGHYGVSVDKYIAAIEDAEMLHGFVLVHSYALAESAAADRLATPTRSLGGIEDWGERLLSANGRAWTNVKGGLAGAVEVAVARNAFAHGSRTIDARAAARLHRAGARARPVDSVVTLSYPELRQFRGRLQSLLHKGGFGTHSPSSR
jgi:hypothetical protein